MSDSKIDFTDGAAYERLMGRWSKLVGVQFLEWLKPAPGLAWLDVGCGNGAFTEEVIARCAPAAITGIDPSEGQIAYARQRPGVAAAAFEIGDAQALPFADASFDIAVMALVIAFIPDPAKAIAEQMRVVRPGGTIATYIWDLPGGGLPLEPLVATAREMGMTPPMPPNSGKTTRDALRQIWRGAGLERIEIETFRITVRFDDFADFWHSCTLPAGPQAKRIEALPPDAKAELQRRLKERLPTAPDGRIAYQSFANAVKGVRPA